MRYNQEAGDLKGPANVILGHAWFVITAPEIG